MALSALYPHDSPTRYELHYLHFTDEKTEALRGWMTAQGYIHSHRSQSWAENPSNLVGGHSHWQCVLPSTMLLSPLSSSPGQKRFGALNWE